MTRILVVDDEPDVIRMITRVMEGRGFHVTTARSGEEALVLASADVPDLVIVDLDLPGMNGFDVCKRIKGGAATGHVPVIVMTAAYVSLRDAMRAATVGAKEYIFKPFMGEILLRNVERLLAARAAAVHEASAPGMQQAQS